MANAIGLRCYQITAHRRGDTTPMTFSDEDFELTPATFISNFVARHVTAVPSDERERSWYFEEREATGVGSSVGYVHYGTFGFESNLVNYRTKRRNYRRKTDDVEEIPLFYEFWCPSHADYGLAAFQSFQGRSCIGLVMERMEQDFERANPGYRLKFKKLLPNDSEGSLYSTAPVKELRLIRRHAPSDVTDRYFPGRAPQDVDFEVVFVARRRRHLGPLGEISSSLRRDRVTGLVTHDGIEFGEAIAKIKVGKRLRPVGVFGLNTDAGVIDITEVIERGLDGHPTFESVQEQSDEILSDFHQVFSRNSR